MRNGQKIFIMSLFQILLFRNINNWYRLTTTLIAYAVLFSLCLVERSKIIFFKHRYILIVLKDSHSNYSYIRSFVTINNIWAFSNHFRLCFFLKMHMVIVNNHTNYLVNQLLFECKKTPINHWNIVFYFHIVSKIQWFLMILHSLLNHNEHQLNSYATEKSQTTQYIDVKIASTKWS